MSSRDVDTTTAQLLQRQSSSRQQNARQYAFAATIAVSDTTDFDCKGVQAAGIALVLTAWLFVLCYGVNPLKDRFFSDNSLSRQRRMIECTKRRQARARDRALEQAYRLEVLQQEMEEAQRVRALKEEREASRMERKLRYVAAAYIQHVWRTSCRRKQEAANRRWRAEQLVIAFLSYRSWKRKSTRRRASLCIQRQWRQYVSCKKRKRGLALLQPLLGALVRARRARAQRSARKVQRWFRGALSRRREHAASAIQRCWRVSVSKARIAYCSRVYRHLANVRRLERSARVLQRALGTHAVYKRLLGCSEFEEYPSVMAAAWPPRHAGERACDALERFQQEKSMLDDVLAERKELGKEEATLAADVESLRQRLAAAKARREEERDRVRRHAMLEEHRRLKDAEAKHRRLQELEVSMRREVRLELEKELETARRLMLRAKKPQRHARSVAMTMSSSDERVELA